jgi:hypothetical protein
MWEVRGNDWKLKTGEPQIHDELIESAKVFDVDGNEILEE